ncbi:MAG: hypothetical protein ACLR4Z_09345 [Butyricicoccaceae bacterium]
MENNQVMQEQLIGEGVGSSCIRRINGPFPSAQASTASTMASAKRRSTTVK